MSGSEHTRDDRYPVSLRPLIILTKAKALRHFIGCRHAKGHDKSGRRQNLWYLVSSAGEEVLAVVGDERDTRDGHYSYYSVEPFASQHALICSNMGTVNQWINTVSPSAPDQCCVCAICQQAASRPPAPAGGETLLEARVVGSASDIAYDMLKQHGPLWQGMSCTILPAAWLILASRQLNPADAQSITSQQRLVIPQAMGWSARRYH